IRILCGNFAMLKNSVGLQWLIGSPFLSPMAIVTTLRCLRTLDDPFSPNLQMESEEIRGLLPRGFEVIGALIAHDIDGLKEEKFVALAMSAARSLRKMIGFCYNEDTVIIGAVMDRNTANGGLDPHFFVSRTSKKINHFVKVDDVVYVDQPEMEVWKSGCIVRCELPIMLPLFSASDDPKDVGDAYEQAIESVEQKLRHPQISYLIEAQNGTPSGSQPVILHGVELNHLEELPKNAFSYDFSDESLKQSRTCSSIFHETNELKPYGSWEKDADIVLVSIMFNSSRSGLGPAAPLAECYPANGEAKKLLVVNYKLEVLSYATKDVQLIDAVSKLIIPAIMDQLRSIKSNVLQDLSKKHPQLQPYQFVPLEYLHPITVIYDLSHEETEIEQVEIRRSLHLRLGLPIDRPLLRFANAIHFSPVKDKSMVCFFFLAGSCVLKDVHHGIPSSGVVGGKTCLIQGSYEYYHYLQDGFDDSGWGCAYRSLQTIISWFRLQQYTCVGIPTHREIQQSLVEMGDKETSFVGSREWIGAIELSFVLEKLVGASSRIVNVRSGDEVPEKCGELALHFQTQGTPVMIGGGVLAYTLLGVDYNEGTGDCAFLILDPHYGGGEDAKKVVKGGWCGWKKGVDAKGKHFFLQDKFYNLLLPQRPNVV
ncbi:hypothetical protein M569_00439, partial [Genlisea aurea]